MTGGGSPGETRRGLAGRRVLVVEDEAVVALDLAHTMRGAGCTVVGPMARLDRAVRAATDEAIDLALLDVSLGGGATVFAVADRLAARAVPFVFLTGYDGGVLPAHLQGRPICRKPHSPHHLLAVLEAALGR